ncbi:MAG TPA: hypothetical protein VFK48_00340 [Usitatibacter sp.]|nr:hypothetical protein [Usitatibacter sp.]
MKRMHTILFGAIAATALGLAVAQPYGGPFPRPCAATAAGCGPWAAQGDWAANRQARLDAMHARLGITAAQEPAWQAFAAAAAQQAEARARQAEAFDALQAALTPEQRLLLGPRAMGGGPRGAGPGGWGP